MKGSSATRQTKSYKRIAAGLTVILLIVAIVTIFKIASTPAEGSIRQPGAGKVSARSSSDLQPMVPIDGKYVSLAYPANFNRATNEPAHGTQLENFSFTKMAMPSWNLNVQVSSLPSGNVADDASYHLRAGRPDQYKKEVISTKTMPAYVFSDSSQGFSKVAFSPHNGLLLTMSLTSYDLPNADKLQAAFVKVLDSVEWRR